MSTQVLTHDTHTTMPIQGQSDQSKPIRFVALGHIAYLGGIFVRLLLGE